MHFGILYHLRKWIVQLMKTHERLDMYNAIWFTVPAYHDLTPKITSYEEVTHWNGTEMKEMSRYLPGFLTQSLWGGSPTQSPTFNHAIQCTRALIELYPNARHWSHDDATLCHMEDAWHHFHTFKDAFLLRRAGKQAKTDGNTLGKELVMQQKVDEETNTQTLTPSKNQREMNTWRDCISHEIDVSKVFPQHNLFQSLASCRSVWEEAKCELRSVNVRRESDPRRAFRPAFGVTRISDDCYGSTIWVVVISLGEPGTVTQPMRESQTDCERCLAT